MPANHELTQLLWMALQSGDHEPLERHLAANSNLPGPRGNLELLNAFADTIGDIIARPDLPVERLETLLDGWASLSLDDAPVNDPREMLPAAAALAYGQAAASKPEWWDDEVAKLHTAASNPRWRTREMVAAALQRMLAADWDRTFKLLRVWVAEDDPLVIRAAAAGIAEPPLLKMQGRGEQALDMQKKAVEGLAEIPQKSRRDDSVRVLRKALGYTVSVAVAAAPDAGFRLLERLSSSSDKDVQWVVRENLKKNRLSPWADRAAAIQAMM
jgi:hypothetical protein